MESEATIRIRIESVIESGVVVYMFNADCHVGVVYLILPYCMLRCMFCFFVCTIGLRVYKLLITYDDDDDDDETEKPTSPTLKTCEWEQY